MRTRRAVSPIPFLSTSLLGILLFCGCNKKSDLSNASDQRLSRQNGGDLTNTAAVQIKTAGELVKSGAIDEAAARLVQIQAAKPDFSPKEAAEYRQTMAEAYTHALEGAQKGDPRAQAALQLLRVARPK